MNISWSEIKPYENELPTNYADRIGRLYTDTVTAAFKKSNGQFFTPVSIAYFMGKQISVNKDSVSVLDPGCGTAILSCAMIENLVLQSKVKQIELVTYETDENLIPGLQKVLEYITIWGCAIMSGLIAVHIVRTLFYPIIQYYILIRFMAGLRVCRNMI